VDDRVLCPERNWGSGSESNDDEEVLPFNEEEDNTLVSVVEEGLIIPPTKVNPRETVPTQPIITFQTVAGSTQGTSNHKMKTPRKDLLELQKDNRNDRIFSERQREG